MYKSRKERIIVNPSLVLREEFDEWAILFDPEENKAVTLNPTGVFIYKHLDGRHTIRDILRKVKEEFEDVPEDVDVHIKDFIDDLISRGYATYE